LFVAIPAGNITGYVLVADPAVTVQIQPETKGVGVIPIPIGSYTELIAVYIDLG
jgi:hypothetical protein